jgi:magnesium chelatase family protein
MSVARILCRAQLGLVAPAVHVEVHLGSGLPLFNIVGLPAAAVKESKERVRAALANSGFEFPAGRITVNLAPADLPKDGGRFDLAIATGILIASGQLTAPRVESIEVYGELGLNGELRSVPGLLLAVAHAAAAERAIVLPKANELELRIAPGAIDAAQVFPAGTLMEVCGHLAGSEPLRTLSERARSAVPISTAAGLRSADPAPDLADVVGQAPAKSALVVAAAGGHSLLLSGPPGCGKSMLAQRLPGLLPELTPAEHLEVATIRSVCGLPASANALPPFRAPHHTASANAIVGGGPRARPGEITLAHRGVLFLDELPEYDRRVREALREPLEAGQIAIARAGASCVYPAKFLLVAAMNSCECGYLGDVSGRCRCPPNSVERYRARVSGPLLDRIDLRVQLTRVTESDWEGATAQPETSAAAAARVFEARAMALARGAVLNAQLTAAQLKKHNRLAKSARQFLLLAAGKLQLSARSLQRVERVAWTIADLAGSENVETNHVAEALQFRRA